MTSHELASATHSWKSRIYLEAAPTIMELPEPTPGQVYVSVSAIESGTFTLPERFFITPADSSARRTVPSLAFLITHPGESTTDRLLFDLGLRGCVTDYTATQQQHIATRRPYQFGPPVAQRLEAGDVSASEIDTILLSHVHWDHTGDPTAFANAEFLVGAGSLEVLRNGIPGKGSHQHFDSELLPQKWTRELPALEEWLPLGPFKHAFDLYEDGSVYVIDLPGHLPGHVGLLCRVTEQGWICLCGDAYHDIRLRTGEREIGTWESSAQTLCIHLDRQKAAETIARLAKLSRLDGVEVIAAHDEEWLKKNRRRLFPATL